MQTITLTCNSNQRADVFVSSALNITRTHAAGLIAGGHVLMSGLPITKSTKLSANSVLTVNMPNPEPLDVEPQDIPLDILFEDSEMLVVNKPKGMVVHPAAGNKSGTLVNALLNHCKGNLSGINGVLRPGILHRIDKDTSGLLLVAKTDAAHQSLAAQIKAHTCNRVYEAVVYGNIKTDSGTVDAPIGRHPVKRKQMAVTNKNSKPAVTHYEVISRGNGFTHVRLKLETGRTHQIRVHMAYIGHPVAGDSVYGPKKVITELNGQCLHARQIGFKHPITQKYMEFTGNLPEYFINFLNKNEMV